VRLIFNFRRSDHVSDGLISLYWLRVPGRIRSKVAVQVYKVLHDCAPSYLGPFTYVADLPNRRGLRCSCSDCLVQPPVHRSTVGSQAFSVAGHQVWNCLPLEVTLTTSKVMVIVWRLRGNIIITVLYIARVLPLQWAQLTKTVYTARLGLEFVFLCFFRLHDLSLCWCMFCFTLDS